MKKIVIHLADGFEEIEAVTPIDVLRRAGFEVTIVSMNGKKEVAGAHGIAVVADVLFEEVDYNKADLIILPGGMPGSKNLDNHDGLKSAIRQFNHHGKPIAAICAAPMVLGHLGILRGKKVTCFPGTEIHLEGSRVTGKAVEVDGNITTGKGPGAAMQFALSIVEQFSSAEAAKKLAGQMMVE